MLSDNIHHSDDLDYVKNILVANEYPFDFIDKFMNVILCEIDFIYNHNKVINSTTVIKSLFYDAVMFCPEILYI